MIAAFRRAYLRQRIRWAEQDLRWAEASYEALPSQISSFRGSLSVLRASLAQLTPSSRPESTVLRILRPRWALIFAVAALVGMLAAWPNRAAAQIQWRHIADMSDGSTWSYAPSTVWPTAQLAFTVRRDKDGTSALFRFQIDATACSAQRGLAQLYNVQGELLQSAPFRFGGPGDAAALARALCDARSRSAT